MKNWDKRNKTGSLLRNPDNLGSHNQGLTVAILGSVLWKFGTFNSLSKMCFVKHLNDNKLLL